MHFALDGLVQFLEELTLVTSSLEHYPETGLLEDTPEPIPLKDSSLDVNKPIAFDIPLSATPVDKSRKKISTKKLKMNQLN